MNPAVSAIYIYIPPFFVMSARSAQRPTASPSQFVLLTIWLKWQVVVGFFFILLPGKKPCPCCCLKWAAGVVPVEFCHFSISPDFLKISSKITERESRWDQSKAGGLMKKAELLSLCMCGSSKERWMAAFSLPHLCCIIEREREIQ